MLVLPLRSCNALLRCQSGFRRLSKLNSFNRTLGFGSAIQDAGQGTVLKFNLQQEVSVSGAKHHCPSLTHRLECAHAKKKSYCGRS